MLNKLARSLNLAIISMDGLVSEMGAKSITVFCDGGLGNRLNALVSGQAISKAFGLDLIVHWPKNFSCGAALNDVLDLSESVLEGSLLSLRGKLGNHTMMLHDQIASERLQAEFSSAYQYSSIDEFEAHVIRRDKPIFYYPALIPPWLPTSLVLEQISRLRFAEDIRAAAAEFISNEIGDGFYGIHLRRTDLNVGLTDEDVFCLISNYVSRIFFVCSDDPSAEHLSSIHPNVRVRKKSFIVSKREKSLGWNTGHIDEDGRVIGNLVRDAHSVKEAAVDMLILAHSTIIGNSGSTFQTFAKLLAQATQLVEFVKPEKLEFVSMNEIAYQLRAKRISVDSFVSDIERMVKQKTSQNLLDLLGNAFEVFEGHDRCKLLYAMAQLARNKGHLNLSATYLRELIRISPTLKDPRLLLEVVDNEISLRAQK